MWFFDFPIKSKLKQVHKGMLIYKINASYGDRFLRVGGIVGKVVEMWPVIVADGILWGGFLLLGDISAQYLLMAAHKDLT